MSTDIRTEYDEKGYIAIPDVLSTETIKTLRDVTDQLVEDSRAVSTSNEVYDLGKTHSAETPVVRRIKHPDLVHGAYDAILRDESILSIVAELIGRDIRYQQTKLNMKRPGDLSPIEWHQDWAFIPHTNDDLLAVGVPIDDMTTENGALEVVPGSHRGPIVSHHQDGLFVGAIPRGVVETFSGDAVPIEVAAGGISIHHTRTLHGSASNRSDKSRRLLLLELGAVDAWPIMGLDESWEEFNSRIITGSPTLEPRMTDVPVRLSLPRPEDVSSLFDLQGKTTESAFAS